MSDGKKLVKLTISHCDAIKKNMAEAIDARGGVLEKT